MVPFWFEFTAMSFQQLSMLVGMIVTCVVSFLACTRFGI